MFVGVFNLPNILLIQDERVQPVRFCQVVRNAFTVLFSIELFLRRIFEEWKEPRFWLDCMNGISWGLPKTQSSLF